MKKLLIALLSCIALIGCNSGSNDSNSSDTPPTPESGTYILGFEPADLTLGNQESGTSVMGIYNTAHAFDITVPVTFEISESDAVTISPTSCTLSLPPFYYCDVHVTKIRETANDIIIHPVVPESYNYIQIIDLIVHNESSE